jgi:hypothetical protein
MHPNQNLVGSFLINDVYVIQLPKKTIQINYLFLKKDIEKKDEKKEKRKAKFFGKYYSKY